MYVLYHWCRFLIGTQAYRTPLSLCPRGLCLTAVGPKAQPCRKPFGMLRYSHSLWRRKAYLGWFHPCPHCSVLRVQASLLIALPLVLIVAQLPPIASPCCGFICLSVRQPVYPVPLHLVHQRMWSRPDRAGVLLSCSTYWTPFLIWFKWKINSTSLSPICCRAD